MSMELSLGERRIVKSIQTTALFLDEHIKETAQGFVCEFNIKDFQDLPKQLQEITFLLTQFDGSGKKHVVDVQALYPSSTLRKSFLDTFINATSINTKGTTMLLFTIVRLAEFFGYITEQMTNNESSTERVFIFTDDYDRDGSEVKKYLGGVVKKLKSLGGS